MAQDERIDPRDLYVTSEISVEHLAALLKGVRGCSLPQLKRRCAAEGWRDLREKWLQQRAEKYRAARADESVEVGRRQLGDARSMQNIGKGLLSAAGHALKRLGGTEGLLGTNPSPKDVMFAMRVGSAILESGLTVERDLLGGKVIGEVPIVVFEIETAPALPARSSGSTNGDQPPSGNGA